MRPINVDIEKKFRRFKIRSPLKKRSIEREILNKILAGDAQFLERRAPKATVWLVDVDGRTVRAMYDPIGGRVVSVLSVVN